MVWQDLCDEIAFDVSGDMSEPLVPKLSSPNDTNSSDSNSDWYCSASTNRGKFKWFCELCLSFQPKRRSNPYAAFQPEQTKLCLNCQIGSFLVKINLSANEVVQRAYRCHVDEQHVDQVIRCQSHADDDDDDDDYSYDDDDDSDSDSDSDDDDDVDGIRRHRPDCGSKVSDSSHSCPLSRHKIAELKTLSSGGLFPSNPQAVGAVAKLRSLLTFHFPCDRLRGCARRQPKTSCRTMPGTPKQYLPYVPQQKTIF